MRPHSSSSSSTTSSTLSSSTSTSSYSFGSTTSLPFLSTPLSSSHPSPTPLLSSLDPVYSPTALAPSTISPPSWLSYAESSLSGLSMNQEDARLQRIEARRRAVREKGNEEVKPITLSTLPLSPPSPTPSLCSSQPPLSLRPLATRQLWPSSATRTSGLPPRRWDGAVEASTGGTASMGKSRGKGGQGLFCSRVWCQRAAEAADGSHQVAVPHSSRVAGGRRGGGEGPITSDERSQGSGSASHTARPTHFILS